MLTIDTLYNNPQPTEKCVWRHAEGIRKCSRLRGQWFSQVATRLWMNDPDSGPPL